MTWKAVDMFGGIGGFRHGLENSDMDVEFVEYIENDKYAVKSYNEIFNEDHELRDAEKVKPEEMEDFDILCAGFPCQSFSIAGNRGGFDDTRGTLFFEIARIAKRQLPKILLLENVKGLLSHADGATFGTVLQTLDELGYDVQWQVLNSKYHRVPQNRERVFIVASRRGESRPKVFPIREPDQRTSEESENRRIEFGEIIPNKQINDGSKVSLCIDKNYHKGLAPSKVGDSRRTHIIDWHGHKDKPPKFREDVPTLRAESHGHQPKLLQKSHDWRENDELKEFTEYRPTIRSQMGDNPPLWKMADDRGKVRVHRNDEKKSEIQGYSFFLPNADYIDVVDNHDKNVLQSAEPDVRIRKLTPRECWRLQGFPDQAFEAAQKVNSDTQLYKQAGNAVTTNVVKDIGDRLAEEL